MAYRSMNASAAVMQATVSKNAFYARTQTDPVLKKAVAAHTTGHSAVSDRHRVNARPGQPYGHTSSPYRVDMVPGYTGFVPQTRDITGHSEAITNKLGVATHDRMMERVGQARAGMLARTGDNRRLRQRANYRSEVGGGGGRGGGGGGAGGRSPASSIPSGSVFGGSGGDVPVPATYNPAGGTKVGNTKYMPQKVWASVGKHQNQWSRDIAEEMQKPRGTPKGGKSVQDNWAAKTAPKPSMFASGADASQYIVGYNASQWAQTTVGGSTWEGILTEQQVASEQRTQNYPVYQKPRNGWVVDQQHQYGIPSHALKGMTISGSGWAR